MASALAEIARLAWRGVLCAVFSASAVAHPVPESRVWMDTTATGVRLSIELPLNRLEFAYGKPLSDHPESVIEREGAGLRPYLLQHVHVSSLGRAWPALLQRLAVSAQEGAADLRAELEFIAPPGVDVRSFSLEMDAVIHEVRTHRILVFLRNDWAGAYVGEAPRLLGELMHGESRVELQLGQSSVLGSLQQLFMLGLTHIAAGTDHLLFLLMLLIIAPVSALGRQWAALRSPRAALKQTAMLVTAFTLGHSLTLALGSLGILSPPARLVEIAVAITIVVAAAHAWQPLCRGAEVGMALGFGMIHGLAFSAILSGAGLSASQHAQALLAFNLGIECMQLIVLVCVLPALMLIARSNLRHYDYLRSAIALGSFVLAILWVFQRLRDEGRPPFAWLEQTADLSLRLTLGLIWLAAALSAAWRRGCRPAVG